MISIQVKENNQRKSSGEASNLMRKKHIILSPACSICKENNQLYTYLCLIARFKLKVRFEGVRLELLFDLPH